MKGKAGLEASQQQREIVESPATLIVVRANAGAGKTTTIALKARAALDGGTAPEKILLLSFTTSGRRALRRALTQVGVAAAVAKQVRVETVNELAEAILRRVEGRTVHEAKGAEEVKPFVVEAVKVARGQQRERDERQSRHENHFDVTGDGSLAAEAWLRAFRNLKGTMRLRQRGPEFRITPASAADLGSDYTTLCTYVAYEGLRHASTTKDASGAVHYRDEIGPRFRYEEDATYDLAVMIDEGDDADLVRAAIEGTLGGGVVSAGIAPSGVDLIGLDEMHDTNRAIIVVLRALLAACPGVRFLGVGDRDQVIHAQAGADPAFLGEGFAREIGRPLVLPLDASYRFGDAVARLLAAHADKAYGSSTTRRTRVDVMAVASPLDQGLYIQRAIEERLGLQPKSPLGELAVLLRHPARAVALENVLLDRGVDYETCGFSSYLMRPEVLFVRALLTAATGALHLIESDDVHTAMLEALLLFSGSSIATTTRSIDDSAVATQKLSIREVVASRSMTTFIDGWLLRSVEREVALSIRAALDIAKLNRIDDVPKAMQALNFESLAARVLVQAEAVRGVVDTTQGLVEAVGRYESIESFLRGTNERELQVRSMRKSSRISLSSIEASKGLEFDHVIAPDVNERDFDGDDGDERNLFYVAASRAKHRLTLMHAPRRPSSYLQPLAQPAVATS